MSTARRSGPLAIVPSIAAEDARVTSAMLKVLVGLAGHADRNHWCCPKVDTLAERIRMHRPNVSRSLRQLERLGYLTIIRRRDDATGRQLASAYTINISVDVPAAFRRAESDAQAESAYHQSYADRVSPGPPTAYQETPPDRVSPGPPTAYHQRHTTKDVTKHRVDGKTKENIPHPQPLPAQAREGERRSRRRRNGRDADEPRPSVELTPPTDGDRELWEHARDELGADWLPANREKLAAIVVLGRGPDGGLHLRVPLWASSVASRHQFAVMLVRAGDAAGANVVIEEGRLT